MLLLAGELVKRHEVTVITGSWEPGREGDSEWVHLEYAHGFLRGAFALPRMARSLLRQMALAGRRFDVVHATFPIRLPKGVARGLVVTWHSSASEIFKVWRMGGMRYRGPVWRNKLFYGSTGWIRRGLPALLERVRAAPGSDVPEVWVAVSHGLADTLKNDLLAKVVDAPEVAVVPNSIHPRFFAPVSGQRAAIRSQLGIEPTDVLAVAVAHGQWNLKGIFEVLAALRQVPENVKLAIVGGSRLHHLEREIRALKIEGRVVLCGFGDPVYYLVASDLCVCASWYEAFGLAAAEAAAAGLPVVATRVHGVTEWLRDGVSGVLCNPDAASIAACIRRLVERPDLRSRLGEAARESVRRYNAEAMALAYEKLYAELVLDGSVRSNSMWWAGEANRGT